MSSMKDILDVVAAGPWSDSENYIRLDERRALTLFVRHATRALAEIERDRAEWVLVLEATHAAAQLAMSAHLSGSTRIGAQTTAAAKRVLAGDWSRERTADFAALLDRLDGTVPRIEVEAPVLSVSAADKADLLTLNDIRCGLVHMMPVGWSIQIDGLPRIALAGARLVLSIIENGHMTRVAEDNEQAVLARQVGTLVDALERLERGALGD